MQEDLFFNLLKAGFSFDEPCPEEFIMMNRCFRLTGLRLTICAILLLAMLPLSQSRADIVAGSSESFGVFADLSLAGVPTLTVPNTPYTVGNAPGPYDLQDQVLSLSASNLLVGSIDTGVMNTFAASDVDGGLGIRFASASSLVNGLNMSLVPLEIGSAVTVTADTVGSSSMTLGDYASLDVTGQSTFENLVITAFGNNLFIPANPDPNTVLFDSDGVRIILNEQVGSVTDWHAFMTTNAIVIELDNVLGTGGLVNGGVIVSNSMSSLTAVPEPSSMILVMGGIAAVLLSRRRVR
jgi:hypothetical protein